MASRQFFHVKSSKKVVWGAGGRGRGGVLGQLHMGGDIHQLEDSSSGSQRASEVGLCCSCHHLPQISDSRPQRRSEDGSALGHGDDDYASEINDVDFVRLFESLSSRDAGR